MNLLLDILFVVSWCLPFVLFGLGVYAVFMLTWQRSVESDLRTGRTIRSAWGRRVNEPAFPEVPKYNLQLLLHPRRLRKASKEINRVTFGGGDWT